MKQSSLVMVLAGLVTAAACSGTPAAGASSSSSSSSGGGSSSAGAGGSSGGGGTSTGASSMGGASSTAATSGVGAASSSGGGAGSTSTSTSSSSSTSTSTSTSSSSTSSSSGASPAAFEYREVADTMCANGSVAGMGVSAKPGATSLLLFFNGGGACWDNVSCFGLNAASHLSTTYSAQVLAQDVAPVAQTGLVDRVNGPFAGSHMAFIPYCTGDLHAGDSVRTYQADLLGLDIRTVNHHGRPNAQRFVTELAGLFPNVTQVYLMGASAGGYGAILNHDLVGAAFPAARVDTLVDGSPFVEPQNGLFGTWKTQWSMTTPTCAGCATSFGALVGAVHVGHPSARFGLITSTNDETIRLYFGYGLNDMTPQVNALVTQQYSATNRHAFVVEGTQHVLLAAYPTLVGPQGVTLRSWVDAFVAGDSNFVTVRP